MKRNNGIIFFLLCLCTFITKAQLAVDRDTITVVENGYVLKLPWANGVNHSNVSNLDLNFDGVKDLVVFDRQNNFGVGRFRCFIKQGAPGQPLYKPAPELSYRFPQVSAWALLMDYNCDGLEDLLCSTNGGIMVYKNISSATSGINFILVKSIINSDFSGAGGSSNSALYVSSIGVPGISDIDNDGDLDVLTFSPQGVLVEYHQNLSKETYSNCDSLKFKLATGCWGGIIETGCSINLNQTCAFKIRQNTDTAQNASSLHAGSCITCIDGDGDGDKDLIMGDVVCNVVQYAYNSGSASSALISDSTKLYPNYPNKNNTTQIRISNFPCAYNVDVDGDSKKDLVAAPNTNVGENTQSLWYYRNTSLTNTVNFQFVKKNFLQDEMIEVGQNSYPVLFDYNADGKKDLLIGTFGYFSVNTLQAKLTLYENIGSLSQPIFSLVTRDYANVSLQGLNNVMPTVGDVDSDGDIDILVGTSNGKIHWLKNSAGPGNPCNFSTFLNNPFNFITQSASASPQLFDIDEDGKLDLMIGGKNGRIAFYRNTGTAGSPTFSLITNTFGNVDVKGVANFYGIDGYASPFFYKEQGVTHLLVGSVSGDIFHYTVPSPTATCNLISPSLNGFNEGGQSTVFFEDITNDGKRDLFIGNASGGVSFFSSNSSMVSVRDLEQLTSQVKIFPNPAGDHISVNLGYISQPVFTCEIKSSVGKSAIAKHSSTNSLVIDISGLQAGLYLIIIEMQTASGPITIVKKFIKL